MNILESLNDVQKQAVQETEGRIRVVAGAGSGKTRVIAHRFAYIASELGVDPANILCTTFTNKAAKEMTSRISKLIGQNESNGFVCTIHSFCLRFLREEIYRIGFPKNFIILDDEDAKILAKDVLDEIGVLKSQTIVQNLLHSIGFTKARLKDNYVELYFTPSDDLYDEENNWVRPIEEIGDLEAAYLRKQYKIHALDYNDLIYVTSYILNHFPDVCEKWGKSVNYIMVDEAQDLSVNQWNIIELLAKENQNLFIVGDPDQCIYEWRGASPDLFLNFKNDKTIILSENYRSTPNILEVANSVISNNKSRIKKDLFTKKSPKTLVVHKHAKTEDEECEWIADTIEDAVKNDRGKYSDFAILYRASFLSRMIEQTLIKKGMKYTVWGGVRFFERREIKDVLAYLRLINGNDDLSFLRVINSPKRGLGETFVKSLKGKAKESEMTLYDTLKANISDGQFNRDGAKDFIRIIDDLREKKNNTKISTLVASLLEMTGLMASLKADHDNDRIENVEELIESIRNYEGDNPIDDISLDKYLQDIALYTNADYKKDSDTIKLMTVHQSKGLEFPYVIVLGLSDGIFPSFRTLKEKRKRGEEEERRLMYVAITRAENALFLTESEGYCFATNSSKYPSRFLKEIKSECLVQEGVVPDELWRGTQSQIEEIEDKPVENFKVKDKVKHKIFGVGEIQEIQSNGSITVKFEDFCRVLKPQFLTKA